MIIPTDHIMTLARQAVETLKPVMGHLAEGVGSHALLDWLKGHLHGSGAEALEKVAQAPENDDEWDVLELRIRQALTKDPSLAKELAALLSSDAGVSLSMVTTGNQNVSLQASGTGNQLNVGGDYAPKPQADSRTPPTAPKP